MLGKQTPPHFAGEAFVTESGGYREIENPKQGQV